MGNRNTAKEKARKVALAGVFAALVFVATELHVPTALGYIHLGDGVILYAGYAIGPAAFLAAAVGSALADLIAGYAVYIAPTFIIKGLMGALTGWALLKHKGIVSRIVAFVAAELIMLAGYFIFECFMYGVTAAKGAIIPNLIQAGGGIVIGFLLTSAHAVAATGKNKELASEKE